MIAEIPHGLKDAAEAFVVADVVADEERVSHERPLEEERGLLRDEVGSRKDGLANGVQHTNKCTVACGGFKHLLKKVAAAKIQPQFGKTAARPGRRK